MAKPMTLAPRNGEGVGPVEVIVRRKCRHGEDHPHSVYRNVDAAWSWCVDGDSRRFTVEKLNLEILSVLQTEHPRVSLDDAPAKTRQIVESLIGGLR